ncbi:HAD family hydrolase [Thermodesulfobacteriota bacterium]
MNEEKKEAAVIFDCDGVMFDSRQANIHFYNHLLTHFGLGPMLPAEVDYVHMHTALESIRYIFRDTSHLEAAMAYWPEVDYAPFMREMVMEPGLRELLLLLKPQFGLAVATNRSNTIKPVLALNGIDQFFDIVVSSLDVKNPKPDPESLFKILDFFNIGPLQTFYVGDSLVDYETAKGAGVPFIAYKNKRLDAVFHADHMMEIAERALPELSLAKKRSQREGR